MAQQGKAGKALAIAAYSSFAGGTISAISIGIGSVLLGITLDFSLHILTHFRNNSDIKELTEALEEYKIKGYIFLPDGWFMWGDNDNFRSVGNVPIQGLGSCIMRKAVELAQDRGLDVIYSQ